MPARMKNPAMVLPDAMEPIQALFKAAYRGGVDPATLELVHLRVSQVNGVQCLRRLRRPVCPQGG
jgi:alkylhydroperoxidase family enzyme